ncbi:unnamed protein product [Nyctereutes procyonoides]|uniref:(raccoon dog) hypothetical protein n=1 Tax=Nyctereutes procyonoides TaxID=34880 RepID=A0A811YD42_NYCPR|nr:unnamed protein product [Nyctereutes procyonoides]
MQDNRKTCTHSGCGMKHRSISSCFEQKVKACHYK